MRIGIDCRIYGSKHTGIGRYVQNLVEELLRQDKENEYVLFVREDFLTQNSKLKTKTQNSKLKTIVTDINHYSLKEQLMFPSIIEREKLDLMHFTHFNVPVFYKGKYIVTIHDLIKHSSRGTETTTRSPLLYWLKYLGYKLVFRQAVKRAEKIITPSQFVKDEVVKEYGVKKEKVVVTHEGVDTKLKTQNSKLSPPLAGSRQPAGKTITQNLKLLERYEVKKPYLLYVGSVYPHKNIERLIEAVKILNQPPTTNHQALVTLVIVCARNVFSERLNKYIEHNEAKGIVKMIGFVPDEELSVLFKEAEAFVFPTLSEGFGLPGLEAMSVGCPVICSNIAVLKEVYKDCVVYFDPLNTLEIAGKIKSFLEDKKLQSELKECGRMLAGTYSWSRMASETMEIYENVK